MHRRAAAAGVAGTAGAGERPAAAGSTAAVAAAVLLGRQRLLDGAGALAQRREVQRRRAVVVAGARRAEGDLVAVLEHLLAADALAVDVGPVEAPEVTKDELPLALLEDAVLLRNDLVQELDRVVRVPSEAVDRTQLDRLLPLGGREDQTCHQYLRRIVPSASAHGQRGVNAAVTEPSDLYGVQVCRTSTVVSRSRRRRTMASGSAPRRRPRFPGPVRPENPHATGRRPPKSATPRGLLPSGARAVRAPTRKGKRGSEAADGRAPSPWCRPRPRRRASGARPRPTRAPVRVTHSGSPRTP